MFTAFIHYITAYDTQAPVIYHRARLHSLQVVYCLYMNQVYKSSLQHSMYTKIVYNYTKQVYLAMYTVNIYYTNNLKTSQ